jgi:hypothetical protein
MHLVGYLYEECVCFDFLYNFCLKHFSFLEERREILLTYIGLQVKCLLFLKKRIFESMRKKR